MAREKTSMTDTFLKSIKAQEKRQELMDDRGLGVWVQPAGKRLVGKPTITFFYRYTSPTSKERQYIKLKRYGDEGVGMTLREARAEREKLEALVADGCDPKTHSKYASGTVEALAKIFLEDKVSKMALQTQKAYKSALKSKVIPILGCKRMAQLKRDEIVRLLDDVNNKAGYEMMRQTKKVLSSFYNFAIDQKAVPGTEINIVKTIELKQWKQDQDRDADSELRWLKLAEIKKFWDYIDQNVDILHNSYSRIWKLSIITGCRPIEAVGMRWSDIGAHVLVDIDNLESIDKTRLWKRPGWLMKNKRPHIIYLSDLAMEVIEPLRKESGDYVFWNADTLLENQLISRRKYSGQLLKMVNDEYNENEEKDKRLKFPRLDIEKFTQRDLRRTTATQMGNMGIKKAHISEVLSHSSLDGSAQITRKHYNLADYIHEKVNALVRWEKKLRSTLGLEP